MKTINLSENNSLLNQYLAEIRDKSYQKNREQRLGPEASKPHRLHRKLTRD